MEQQQIFNKIKDSLIAQINHIYQGESQANTITHVKRLLNNSSNEYQAEDHYILTQLLNKVDISKRVYMQYDGEWKKPINKTLVPDPILLALALIFVQCALTKTQQDEHERGYFFKYLNTAFNCIYMVKTDLSQMKQSLNHFCQKLLPEAL